MVDYGTKTGKKKFAKWKNKQQISERKYRQKRYTEKIHTFLNILWRRCIKINNHIYFFCSSKQVSCGMKSDK